MAIKPPGYTFIGNIKGEKGAAGPAGPGTKLIVGTVTTLAEGAPATIKLIGEAPFQVMNVGIPRGLPGSGAVATDTAVSALFSTQGTATRTAAEKGLAGTFARSSYVRRIEDFLLDGETLDTSGTASIHPIRQRAIDALNAQYLADANSAFGQHGYQIEYPAGHFRIAIEATARSGVGERGQGMKETFFHPEGTQRFMVGGADAVNPLETFDDITFQSFTVDSAKVQKSGATYDGSLKGIFIRNLRRFRMENVRIMNTWATAFGLDYIREGDFINCIAKNTGRGHRANDIGKPTDDEHIGSGAGFGLGTGLFQDEPVRYINCDAQDCYTSAFFTETVASVGATYRSRGQQFIGCSGSRSWYGFLDAGSDGAIISGCNFSRNLYCGFGLDGTHASPSAGINGKFTDSVVSYNGEGNSSAAGIVIARLLAGGYTIDGVQVIGNFGPGVRFIKDDSDSYGPNVDLTIRSCTFTENQGAAIRAARPLPPRTKFEHNTTRRNTAALEIVNGPSTAYISPELRIRFNDFAEPSTITQTLSNPFVTSNIGISQTAPSALVVTPDAAVPGRVNLSWTPAVETPNDYRVEWQDTATGAWNAVSRAASPSPTQTISGLPSLAQLLFRVASVNGSVVGTFAPSVSRMLVPTPYAADYFNRADGVLIAAPDGANALPWNDRDAGAWQILDRSIRPTTTFGTAVRKALTLNAGSADGTVRVRYSKAPPVASDVSTAGLLVRYVDAANYVVLDMTSGGVWQLRKRVASTYTTIIPNVAPVAVGDVVMVSFSGNTYRVAVNDRPAIIAADAGSSHVAATDRGILQPGITSGTSGTPMKWDDFEVWNVGP